MDGWPDGQTGRLGGQFKKPAQPGENRPGRDRVRVEPVLKRHAGQQGDQLRRHLVARAGKVEAELDCPVLQRPGQSGAHLTEALGADLADLGVADGVQPQFKLREQPGGSAGGRAGERPGPHAGQATIEVGQAGKPGGEAGDRLGDPVLEQGDQQAGLAAEVVVQRSGGAVCRGGDRLDRGGVITLPGKQVGGGVEQPATGLGASCFLGAAHGRAGYIRNTTYVDRLIYLRLLGVAGPGAPGP